MITPGSTPSKKMSHGHARFSRSLGAVDEGSGRVHSPSFSELMPKYQDESRETMSNNLAERRRKAPLAPIQTSSGRRSPCRPGMQAIPDFVSPLSTSQFDRSRLTDDDYPSMYSQDDYTCDHPEPLYLRSNMPRRSGSKATDEAPDAVLESYSHWAQMPTPSMAPRPSPSYQSFAQRPRRSKSNAEGLRHPVPVVSMPPPVPPKAPMRAKDSPLFSPLPLYFRGQGFPTEKKGEKTLIGSNGWLERTGSQPVVGKKTPPKKTGLLDSIKKIAKDMVSREQLPGELRS